MSALGMLLHGLKLIPLEQVPKDCSVVVDERECCELCGSKLRTLGFFSTFNGSYMEYAQCTNDHCLEHQEQEFQRGWDEAARGNK